MWALEMARACLRALPGPLHDPGASESGRPVGGGEQWRPPRASFECLGPEVPKPLVGTNLG